MIKAVVGAGGKTTYIKKQAEYYRQQGYNVFVTVSTHMFIEKYTRLTDDAEEIIRELEDKHYVMAGIPDGIKIRSLSYETYQKVCDRADVVLIEADGSRHMPLKWPSNFEPVIYENVDEIVIVCGLAALGKKAADVVHRMELAQNQMPIVNDTMITPFHVQQFVKKGYLDILREQFPEKKISIYPVHDGSLYQRTLAELLKAEMDVSLIRESWFVSRPKLVICGGGHVAYELVQMAACLDFSVKVIDDREEFANKERFPEAEEVICDSFDHLEQYLEEDAYYVVVTRGHMADYECVKMILSHSYQYLGMIGSRKKVKHTFEKLQEDGYSEEQISTIFAPIGLAIKAVTPAEIAVSILAQIIQEKNGRCYASVSAELLDTREDGVLCVIIEKQGSSPRGVGSMMFVTDMGVIDSIGGGILEAAVVEDAKVCKRIMIKEYDLNNEESQKLGMICGGRNKILFVPLHSEC